MGAVTTAMFGASGWTIDRDVRSEISADIVGLRADDEAWSFDAHSGRLVLHFEAWRYSGRTASWYRLGRAAIPHPPVLPLLAAGVVAGLLGWLGACSLYRRAGERPGRAAVPTVLLFALAPAVFVLVARNYAAPMAPDARTPMWYLLFVAGGDHPYVYAALSAMLALSVASLRRIKRAVRFTY